MESIDLISFLRNYYGIVNESLKVNKLTHIDVKKLFPDIKRTSTDCLNENIDKLYSGELILVYDAKGNILPYVNPHLEILEELEGYNNMDNDLLIDISDMNLAILSKDELLKLRHKLRRNHQKYEEYQVVKAIRLKKDFAVKEYKKEKKLLKVEEYNGKDKRK